MEPAANTDAAAPSNESADTAANVGELPEPGSGGQTGSTSENPASATETPEYGSWADVAAAVEDGTLEGEGFKPSGSGTKSEPYAIGTPEAFAWWALAHADTAACLEADIDLTVREGEPLAWPGDAVLSAELDGRGHAVLFSTEGAGLFAEMAATGAVRWLTLGRTPAQLAAGGTATEVAANGALAGSVADTNKGEVEGVVNLMPVGFSAEAPVDAERFAGGIVAVNDGTVKDCANLGAVENDATVGNSAAGGIAAKGTGTIATSYNAGDVRAAQNAAYIVALLGAEGNYASAVDNATCYLAPGEEVYEGVAAAGQNRPGALSADELTAAADRLNDGRVGDAAVWAKPDAADGPTVAYPAPAKPANPGAAPALLSLAAPRATATYADWAAVGQAVDSGALGSKPVEQNVTFGDGTTGSAYLIGTPEQLAWWAYKVNTDHAAFGGSNAKLTANIDLSGESFGGVKTDSFDQCLKWTPVGSKSAPFTGKFAGEGFQVENLYTQQVSYAQGFFAGFFGAVGKATISDFGTASGLVQVDGVSGAFAGGITGFCGGGATLTNCWNGATVRGARAGGIAGQVTDTISLGQVSLTRCRNEGTIEAKYDSYQGASGEAGGLIAAYSTGSDFVFDRCMNVGDVSSDAHASGFIGYLSLSAAASTIKDCCNLGSVTGRQASGFVGTLYSASNVKVTMTNSYNAGSISSSSSVDGQLCGFRSDTHVIFDKAYSCSDRVSGNVAAQGISKTEAEMKNRDFSALLNDGRTGENTVWAQAPSGYGGYPFPFAEASKADWAAVATGLTEAGLRATPVHEGDIGVSNLEPGVSFALEGVGTAESPLRIATPEALAWFVETEQLQSINDYAWNAYVEFVADFDMSGARYGGYVNGDGTSAHHYETCLVWRPNGYPMALDGRGHVVKNLYSLTGPRSDGAGLFCNVDSGDGVFAVRNLGVESGYVYGENDNAGSICAFVEAGSSYLENCWNGAFVSGMRATGGLIGRSAMNALKSCWNVGDVTGTSGNAETGGLIGTLYQASVSDPSVAEDCFNRGSVQGATDSTGGLVGLYGPYQPGGKITIKNSYNAGAIATTGGTAQPLVGATGSGVSSFENCFVETAAGATASQGTAISRSALRSESTLNALNGSRTGDAAPWGLSVAINDGYPNLQDKAVFVSWANVGERQDEAALRAQAVTNDTPGVSNLDSGVSYALSGDGTPASPLVIATPEALAWFATRVNAREAKYVSASVRLAADIDLAGFAHTGQTAVGENFGNCLPWVPIGGGSTGGTYDGIIDGNGKKIENLFVDLPSLQKVGLVGSAGNGASISNLTVASGRVTAEGYVGSIVGFVAGLVKVLDCSNAADVVRAGSGVSHHAGGLVGGNDAAGSANLHVEIMRCVNSGSVISNSTGDSGVGGIAGYVPGYSSITACYNKGSIGGASDAGGILGGGGVGSTPSGNYTRVTNCYNAGAITAQGYSATSAIASWKAIIVNCLALPGVTENRQKVTGAPTVVTADQLRTWGAAYQLSGGSSLAAFSDATVWRASVDSNGDGVIDAADDNSGYPTLVPVGATGDDGHLRAPVAWNEVGLWVDDFAPAKKPAGAGTTASPYEVGTPEALAWWHERGQGAEEGKNCIRLTQDVSLVGATYGGSEADPVDWVPHSSISYPDIDGGGHRITGLEGGSLLGLDCFHIAVRELGIELGGYGVRGNFYAGALAYGVNSGLIEDCYVVAAGSAKVTLASADGHGGFAGGLIGNIGGEGATMKNCYAAVPVVSEVAGVEVNGLATCSLDTGDFVGNCFYDADAAGAGVNTSAEGVAALDSARAKSAALAFALNAGRTGAAAPWSWAADANGGYPYFGAEAPVMSDWGQVGAFQSEADLRTVDAGGGLKALSGTGTAADPYVIATPEALAWFAYKVNAGTTDGLAADKQNAKLAADIDLAGTSYTGADAAQVDADPSKALRWIPLGSESAPYQAAFDGGGHTVDHAYVSGDTLLGLFSCVSGGSVSNVVLGERSLVTGGGNYIAGLVGCAEGATIRGCRNKAAVSLTATIPAGTEIFGNHGGGVVAWLKGSAISDCVNEGPVSGKARIGGVVGVTERADSAEECVIERCANLGAVASSTYGVDSAGILMGSRTQTLIKDCYNRGAVSTVDGISAGGLYARTYSANKKGITIENCYNAANVTATRSGSNQGVFGWIASATGTVTLKNCYYDSSFTGTGASQVAPAGQAARATDQLASWGAAYALNGGDGANALDSLTAWRRAADASENNGYPVLIASGATGDDAHLQPAANWGEVGLWVDAFAPESMRPTEASTTWRDGASDNAYQISTAEQLAWFAYKANSTTKEYTAKNVRLTAPIDLAGLAYTGKTDADAAHQYAGCLPWTPIAYSHADHFGADPFTGRFDGAGFPITDLRLVGDMSMDAGGLFAVAEDARIERVGIASGSLEVVGDPMFLYWGSLIGSVGGFDSSFVKDCYSRVDVFGPAVDPAEPSIGGLVGDHMGSTLENCYFAGTIVEELKSTDGKVRVRPVVGLFEGGPRINCFYDASTSHESSYNESLGVEGIKAASADQMRTWGFVYQLNGGVSLTALADAGAWRAAADSNGNGSIDAGDENSGFPVLVTADATGDAAHLQPAADWSDVGAWVDAFAPAKKPVADAGGTYQISTPEQLAWFAYKVNAGSELNRGNALITSDLDLAGNAYTGKTGVGEGFADCLEWMPIGIYDIAGGVEFFYMGHFDGGGRSIDNLRIVGSADHSGGLFGDVSGALVENVALRSGSIDLSVGECTGSLIGSMDAGNIKNCFSKVDVVVAGAAIRSGALFGDVTANVSSCYYAGALPDGANVDPIASRVDGVVSKVLHLNGTSAVSGTQKLTADQLASWGAAYALNGGDGAKALDSLTAWRKAADGENNGYPVLVASGATGDAAHLQPAADWGEVGLWVDAFAPDKQPAADAGGTYQISTPEQLAWFAYKVNAANGEFGAKNAVLTQPVDLFGGAYTGKTFDAAASDLNAHLEADALVWVPIGNTVSGTNFVYAGTFDGRRLAVSHLFTPSTGERGGLFGNLSGTATGAAIEASYVCGEDVGSVVGMMHGASALVERCSASGNVKVSGSDMTGGMVGHAGFESSRVANCYSLASVTGSGYSGGSGIVGYTFKGSIENCYFAGTAEEPVLGMNDSAGKGSNNYYLEGSFTSDSISKGQAKQVAANDLKSWGAAYQLNAPFEADGTQKALDALTVWRKAANDSENGGYPVLVDPGATGDAAHLQPAANWGEVGAWVNAFAPDRKPAEVDAPASWGKPEGAKAYAIASPEQLAWFVEGAPRGADGATPDALVTAPIDLAGNVYTGESGTGADFGACLEWASGYLSGSVFDGGGQSITNLYQKNKPGGLFSMIKGDATVRNVALQSGLVWVTSDPAGPVGTFAMNLMNATVENCFSRVSIKNDSGYVPSAGFVGTAYYSRIDACYFAGALSGSGPTTSCFYGYDDCTGTVYTDQGATDAPGVKKMTTAELKSWNGAYQLNGSSYVGKPTADGGKVSSTVWTTDDAKSPANDGYPVFGNLELAKLSVTVDPNDVLAKPLGSDQPAKKVAGAFMAGLVEHPLTGTVTLVEAPAAPTGVTLGDFATVDEGFFTWGSTNANAQIALAAGSTPLKADTAAGTVLASAGLPCLDVHVAAAYNAAEARETKFAVMDASGGYEVTVNVKAVTEKTLDVSVPVESGASFDLAPDGQVHENVMAKAPSTLTSNNFVPIAGSVSSVAPLAEGTQVAYPDGSTATVSAVLSPTNLALAPTEAAIDDGSKVRLFAGAATGQGDTLGLTPLAASLYFDPTKKTVPLAFAVAGDDPAVWKWGMDYTGTFLEPDGVFGFSIGYSFGLSAQDVPITKLEQKA